MPVLQFKGKTAIECYHHTVAHHTLEFDSKPSALGKGEKPGLDGNLLMEREKLIALCKRFLPRFPFPTGPLDPVASLLPRHSSDWLFPAGRFAPENLVGVGARRIEKSRNQEISRSDPSA